MDSIEQTMHWHSRVAAASEKHFGHVKPLQERIELAANLIREETRELLVEFNLDIDQPIDLAAIAKEGADALFVIIQAMHTLGIPFYEVYQEVLRSNESKLVGGVKFREDGKLLKGDAYSPADIAAVLEDCR